MLVRTTQYRKQRMGDIEASEIILNTEQIGHIVPGSMQVEQGTLDVLIVAMVYGVEFYIDVSFSTPQASIETTLSD